MAASISSTRWDISRVFVRVLKIPQEIYINMVTSMVKTGTS